jgi:hypothetical protein
LPPLSCVPAEAGHCSRQSRCGSRRPGRSRAKSRCRRPVGMPWSCRPTTSAVGRHCVSPPAGSRDHPAPAHHPLLQLSCAEKWSGLHATKYRFNVGMVCASLLSCFPHFPGTARLQRPCQAWKKSVRRHTKRAVDPLTACDSVPVPSRSPGRRLQPPAVWCATICGIVQYLHARAKACWRNKEV